MPDHSLWDMQLALVTHSFHRDLSAFTYRSETYNDWAWLALEAGRFRFRVGRGETAPRGECGAGEWVTCPPGEPLQRLALEPVTFHFMRFTLRNLTASQALELGRGLQTLGDSARLRANFAALREARYGLEDGPWKAHLLRDLLLASYRERTVKPVSYSPDIPMQRVRDWLETHFEQKISLETLAQAQRLSPSAFSRRFRAATGQSPQEFLLEKRLDQVRHLLLTTDGSIEAIAARCGFANGFYLSRLWKKRFGVPPARFRRLHRL